MKTICEHILYLFVGYCRHEWEHYATLWYGEHRQLCEQCRKCKQTRRIDLPD